MIASWAPEREKSAAAMTVAAVTWLSTLDCDQLALAAYDPPLDPDSEIERLRWYYTPTHHGGLAIRDQNPRQQSLAVQLLGTGLSTAGYATVVAIMGLEDILDQVEGWSMHWGRERGRDPGLYWLRVFGRPGDRVWGWRFGGHHISLNYLIVEDLLVSTTPCFIGADPAATELLGGTLRPLQGAEDTARQLALQLDADQARAALLHPSAVSDIVSGNRPRISRGDTMMHMQDLWRGRFTDPELDQLVDEIDRRAEHASGYTGHDHARVAITIPPRGVSARDLDQQQRRLLRAVISTYTGRAPRSLAEAHAAHYASDAVLDEVHFAWAGATQAGLPRPNAAASRPATGLQSSRRTEAPTAHPRASAHAADAVPEARPAAPTPPSRRQSSVLTSSSVRILAMTSSLEPISATRALRAGTGGVLLAMCLSLVLVVASVSALNLALPDLAVDLGASNTDLTWIADGYTVALAALVLPLGALGDRIGRRKVLIAGNLVFAAASFLAAQSSTSAHLIVWRVVMGVGAAMIMPGTLSTITAAFPPERKTRGVAIWSGFAAAGAIIGMLAAGALLEQWTWKSIFITSAVTAFAAAAAAALLAPETRSATPEPVDAPGVACTMIAVGALVYGIIEGSDRGWSRPEVIAAFAACAAALLGYALAGLRAEHPLLDPRLFGLPGFRAGTISILTQFLAVFGFFFVGLQFLQLILGYSPLKSAVALIPVAAVVMPVSVLTPRLVLRAGLKTTMGGGLLFLAGGMSWVSRLHADSGYVPFLIGLLLAGVGIGLTGSTGTSAIVASLGPDQQGVASAMNDTSREVGSALGIAVMGSVFSSQYRNHLPGLTRLPADAAEHVRHSAAAGLDVASHLGAQGAPLVAAVRDAFMHGFTAATAVAAAILAVAALGAILRAPHRLEHDGGHAAEVLEKKSSAAATQGH